MGKSEKNNDLEETYRTIASLLETRVSKLENQARVNELETRLVSLEDAKKKAAETFYKAIVLLEARVNELESRLVSLEDTKKKASEA